MKIVVDTNVAIVANGKNTHASLECQLACVTKLEKSCKKDVIHIDDQSLIFKEYNTHLSLGGAPGAGDMFFKHIHTHIHIRSKVRQIPLTPHDDLRRGFYELPENDLDPSDRKFLAVAHISKSKIINACDTDWDEQRELLVQMQVEIEQMCPEHGFVTV